jgi:hypothetical protein
MCPATALTKTAESFPYYVVNISELITDAMNSQGVLQSPVTLTITAVYTDPASHQVYSGLGVTTIQPYEIDPWSERQVDITLSTTGQYSFGREPLTTDWQTGGDALINQGGLRLKDINFPDFGSSKNITLVGDAVISGTQLQLTPKGTYYQTGAAWFSNPQFVQDGFETTFRFRIYDLSDFGADGLAFVIQNHAQTAIGSSGGSMGYAFIPNSLAVEFDTWQNSEIGDPNTNHISVQTRGTEMNDGDHAYSLGTATSIPDLSDGNVHTATLRYTPGTLSVYLDNPSTPVLTAPVMLSNTLALMNGRAWVGFTAAAGGALEKHDILSWTFARSSGDPSANIPIQLASRVSESSIISDHTYANSNEWSPPLGDARWHGGYLQPVTLQHFWADKTTPVSSVRIPALFNPDRPAATLIVSNQSDSGSGSLRQAMLSALAGDTITLAHV